MEVSAQFELTDAEWQRGFAQGSRTFRRFLPLAPVCGGFFLLTRGFEPAAIPAALVITLIYVVLIYVMAQFTIAKCVTMMKRLYGPTEVRISADSLHITTPMFATEWRAAAFVEVRAAKDFWFFKTMKSAQIIVPRRAFSPEDAAALDALCAAKTSGNPTTPPN